VLEAEGSQVARHHQVARHQYGSAAAVAIWLRSKKRMLWSVTVEPARRNVW
jgi:hypothetical protein